MGDVAVEDEDAVDDEDAVEEEEDTVEDAVDDEVVSNWWPKAVAIAAMTTSTPAARILRIRIRRGVGRARLP